MIIEIDSVEGEIRESRADQSSDVVTQSYGRGQFVATIRLPDGITIEQFEQRCDAMTTNECCSTSIKAHEFYGRVIASLKQQNPPGA